MSILAYLGTKVGPAAAKFLLRRYLAISDDIAGGLADVAKAKLEDWQQQQDARRQFERIGEAVVNRLLPLFERESQSGAVNVEAVAIELGQALEGRVSAEFFIDKDLDPRKLTDELRRLHPVRPGHFSEAESALYQRALAEAVRYITGIAASLPKFQATFAAQSLTRLTHMQGDLGKVLDSVQHIESTLAARGPDEAERFEADYRQAVLRNLDYLELFGADIPLEARRHSLSVAYVSLNLQSGEGRGAEAVSLPAEETLAELSARSGRLLIRGSAGSGKSTLFRWAAIEAALAHPTLLPGGLVRQIVENMHAITLSGERAHAFRKSTAGRPRAEGGRLPFLVRLRDCAGGRLPSPESFPELVAKEIGEPPAQWVTSVLRDGRGLVLLDGLDEVPGRFRDAVLHQEIQAIVDAYPDNCFVVSTRPEAVDDGWLAGLDFGEARINPMSDLDRRLLIDKWHKAVAAELARRGQDTSGMESLAGKLKDKLLANPPLNRLASNPLLCAMICALHRERRQKLPESQSELCEALCHMLLHRRELESGLDLEAFPEPYRRLSYSQKKLLVQEIAHHMVAHTGESVIRRDEATELVGAQLARMPEQRPEDAQVVLDALVERSGVLREATPATPERPAQLDFLHNTFKEYLAGLRLADEDAHGLLADNAAKPDWLPVLLFAAATERKGFATRLVQKLLGEREAPAPRKRRRRAKPTPEEQERRQRTLIALQCRAVALDLDPELQEQLDKAAKPLLPPPSLTDAEALAACGDLAVPFLGPQRRLSAVRAAACVRALRLIGTKLARRQLRDFLNDERRTVIAELAQAVNPLEIRAVQRMVQPLLAKPAEYWDEPRRERGIRSQIEDLAPLSGLPNVQRLDLRETRVADLAPLASLGELEELSLAETPVCDVEPLAALTALRSLDLSFTEVADAGLAHLRELKGLQSLELAGTQVTDAGLEHLRELKGLQELVLTLTKVTDAGLAHLRELKGLQSLSLGETQVTDAGLAHLRELKGLQALDLGGTQVTDDGLEHLRELKGLQALNLWGTQVTDAGLEHLRELKGLLALVLEGTQVTDAGLAALKKALPKCRIYP